MSETQESVPETLPGEVRSVVLRIPGEHFFCETIDVPRNLDPDALLAFAEQSLGEEGLTPFPLEQEAWGYYASLEHGRMLLFAASTMRLRQLGWQNLEVFRRVFPSFVSLLGKEFDKPTICLFRHEETLTGASFEANCPVPTHVFSLPVTEKEDEEGRCDETRGKLLSLFDLERHEIVPELLVTGEVQRTKDGFFNFDHHLADSDPEDPPAESVKLSANELWTCDVRSTDFKQTEQARREWVRRRWIGFLGWGVGVAALVVAFVGAQIFAKKANEQESEAQRMAAQVPFVLESQKLLEKLHQNKLGGIDPFGALGRLASQRGGQGDQPHVWFTSAHFASRNEIILEGQGRNVESVNNFIKGMEDNGVGNVQVDKSGDKKRKIVSSLGKTTFKIELLLVEEKTLQEANATVLETTETQPEG